MKTLINKLKHFGNTWLLQEQTTIPDIYFKGCRLFLKLIEELLLVSS